MSFLNLALLGGLAAIAIPIIIHLLNRRTAKVLDWGAMLFLLESVESRKKRIQLEEALLPTSGPAPHVQHSWTLAAAEAVAAATQRQVLCEFENTGTQVSNTLFK